VRIEWNEEKNVANQARHNGLDFETASRVFNDPLCVFRKDRVDETGEQRWHAIGSAGTAQLVLVVHVYRSDHDEEIIRIISARKARKQESRGYFQQASD
jgi:uncharacterized DUF497 family protein